MKKNYLLIMALGILAGCAFNKANLNGNNVVVTQYVDDHSVADECIPDPSIVDDVWANCENCGDTSDIDGDGIIFNCDACDTEKGSAQSKGCPDEVYRYFGYVNDDLNIAVDFSELGNQPTKFSVDQLPEGVDYVVENSKVLFFWKPDESNSGQYKIYVNALENTQLISTKMVDIYVECRP